MKRQNKKLQDIPAGRSACRGLKAPWIIVLCFIFVLGFALLLPGSVSRGAEKKAKAKTVKLRVLSTSDLHGQLTTTDYETGGSYNQGSLAKAYNLIQKAKSERPDGNTMLFDIGDVLYDYTTDYIYDNYPDRVQPIYKMMASVGYDAITLGNHDFDYGFDYIQKQLKNSGMESKVVVSNVMDSVTGEHVWKENMLINKSLKTEDGKTVKVKVGIIGETIPKLTSKRESYVGILETEDMLENVEAQAAALKKKGADVIIVLAHSGFGPEEPDALYKNVVYAMTKIKDVDVILCGHEHNLFPSDDSASANYYNLPGVDKETGLVNGTCVVMASDRGKSIGLADITLSVSADNKVTVKKMQAAPRKVTASAKADEKINDGFGKLAEEMMSIITEKIGTLDKSYSLQNYYGLLEDNAVMQLRNDSKLSYAMNYIANKKPQYQNYPLVASSEYVKYGENGNEDYADSAETIFGGDISDMQGYNRYIALYEISGDQLKEWIEWSASAYETAGNPSKWSDEVIRDLMSHTGLQPLIAEDWMEDWSRFSVFDGVEYTIDLTEEPRYSRTGVKLNNTSRVRNLTYNGEPVTSSMKLVLVCDRITKTAPAIAGLDEQYIVKGFERGHDILKKYIREQCEIEPLKITPDYNWSITGTGSAPYLAPVSNKGLSYAKKEPWFGEVLAASDINTYISAMMEKSNGSRPNVVLSKKTEVTTNRPITVMVRANAASGLAELKYAFGNYEAGSASWAYAQNVENGQFTASSNGIYTVYAKDKLGNVSVSKIHVGNLNMSVLEIPTVVTYTNRKTKIQGTGEPGSTIYFETPADLYSDTIKEDGTYAYDLPAQMAGEKIYVYVQDSQRRTSEKVEITIKRTGPNQPGMDTITNKQARVTGRLNDTNVTVYAVIGSEVYVSKEGREAYELCEKFSESKKIIETKVTIDGEGNYAITIPPQNGEKKITVYTIDHISRVSRSNFTYVETVAPNPPSIYNSYSMMCHVSGKIYNKNADTSYQIVVEVDGTKYYGATDRNGYYTVPVERLESGQKLTVYAMDEVDGSLRTSYKTTKTVASMASYLSSHPEEIVITEEVTDKNQVLEGFYSEPNVTLNILIGKTMYEIVTDEFGGFTYTMPELEPGTNFYLMKFSEHGSLQSAAKGTVKLALPEKPYLIDEEVNNNTKTIRVACVDSCTIRVAVGDKTYTTSDGVYDDELKAYVYEIEITRVDSGTKIKIYASNSAGNSEALSLTVIERAPDAPEVEEVDTKTTSIKGTVDLVADKDNPDMELTAANTGTKVFAQIGSKEYEGKVKDDGSFTIKIPKQKKNTSVTVWGENNNGRGPQTKLKVKEAEEKKK
ncbi:Ig-like domain-containing protein [Anaerolentibacter hominis]|uniref:Ig-like domain-containing protein n=1 Tax=Anaerolentibacter hominis TaxID=3079009 RepID=UPI0031B8430D